MVEPHTEVAPPVAWGLGFGLSGPLAFHWGDNPGYKHLAVLDPSAGAGLVVLTNSDAGWRLHLAAAERTVLGAAFPAWLERAYEAPGPSLHR